MTAKEPILTEIERLKVEIPYHENAWSVLNKLKIFINSLPATVEQPSEDFKEEFNNFCVHGNIRNPNFEGPFGYGDIRKTAIHFVDWQKEQTINKARKWLAGNVINYIWKGSGGGIGIRDDFFIDFEKAMKDER